MKKFTDLLLVLVVLTIALGGVFVIFGYVAANGVVKTIAAILIVYVIYKLLIGVVTK